VNKEERKKEQTILKVLRKVAPGTELRSGIDLILSGKTGALIVIGRGREVLKICNGGFEINCPFTSHKLFELAKMDGAIIIDDEIEKIIFANVHLVPDPTLPSSETGIRHRTAERVAEQSKAIVISISQSRDVVSLYIEGRKHILEDIKIVLTKANQALQTLERYRARLDQVSSNLSALEFEDFVTISDVINVIQRGEMVERVAREIGRYITELGSEGRLIRMQLDELMIGIIDENMMVIRDYCLKRKDPNKIKQKISELSSEQLFDQLEVIKCLGYVANVASLDKSVHPKGYRLLRKIPRLPLSVVNKIVKKFFDLQNILEASVEELDDVEGVGEVRAKAIKEGLKRIKEYNLLERYL
jgi:diadenylate cyclase